MNKIQQAYEQGLRVRAKLWYDTFWIKKYSDTESIDYIDFVRQNDWDFNTHPDNWEIWNEDLPLFTQPDIKAQIQTHLNQIQELLKQL